MDKEVSIIEDIGKGINMEELAKKGGKSHDESWDQGKLHDEKPSS